MAVFGNSIIGANTNEGPANKPDGGVFTISELGMVSKLTAYIGHRGTAGNVKGLIYSISGGEPNTLLGTSNAAALADAMGWIDLTFSSAIELAAGDYFLAIITDTGYELGVDAGGGQHRFGQASGSYASPPSPWDTGSDNSNTDSVNIYATYTQGSFSVSPSSSRSPSASVSPSRSPSASVSPSSSRSPSSSVSPSQSPSSSRSPSASSSPSASQSPSPSRSASPSASFSMSPSPSLPEYVSKNVGMKKRYQYKIYSSTGQFLATWDDVVNDPEFKVVINGGNVELSMRLARTTVNFGEESDVSFLNNVQVWCFDNDAPEGVIVFDGYISRYDPRNDGGTEYVQVYALGYHTMMQQFVHEDSLGATGVAYNSIDPGKIAEDIINKAQLLGLPIQWDELTLQKTGTVVSYTFQANTVQECIDKILELTPAGWYWYIDTDKKLHLHPKEENFARHVFTMGREIFYIEPQKRVENVVNRVYFIGGIPEGETAPLFGRYERQASIQKYGLRSLKKVDQRVKLRATMDTVAANILDSQREIEIRTVIRVKDNDYDPDSGYDIESIKVGDTCYIRNYQDAFTSSKWDVMVWDVDFWDYNVRNLTEVLMQIVEIQYTPNWVELTISSKIPNVSKRIEDINRNLIDTQALEAPENPELGSA